MLLLVNVLNLVGHVVAQLLRRLHHHLPATHRSQAPPAPSSERASEAGSEAGRKAAPDGRTVMREIFCRERCGLAVVGADLRLW
eukprot:SAG11_NODE_38523_length_252_cov_0.647059_1_plen_83_part_11